MSVTKEMLESVEAASRLKPFYDRQVEVARRRFKRMGRDDEFIRIMLMTPGYTIKNILRGIKNRRV